MIIPVVASMTERPIVKAEYKPKRNPNDKVRIKIYKRTATQGTKVLHSFADLVA